MCGDLPWGRRAGDRRGGYITNPLYSMSRRGHSTREEETEGNEPASDEVRKDPWPISGDDDGLITDPSD